MHDDEQFPPPRRPPTSTETSYGCPATSPSQPGPDRRTKSPVGRKSSHGGLLLLSFSVLQSRAGNGASVSDGTRRRGRGASALYPRSDPRPLHGRRDYRRASESARVRCGEPLRASPTCGPRGPERGREERARVRVTGQGAPLVSGDRSAARGERMTRGPGLSAPGCGMGRAWEV